MKRVGKPVFFIVAILILALTALSIVGIHTEWGDTTYTYVKGVNDIRWGIDIQGGVEATFVPVDPANTTSDQLKSAETVIKQRLVGQNITDSEVYTDYDKQRIIVRFPWPADMQSFNVDEFVAQLGEQAEMTFRKGTDEDENGNPTGEIVLTGEDITSATAGTQQTDQYSSDLQYVVQLNFTDEGTQKFAEATEELAETGGQISIWLDNDMISAPTVETAITDGNAVITGDFTAQEASDLASTIKSGSLPVELTVNTYSTISPTLGLQARDMMALAAVIAFVLISIFMIWRYRIPGVCASIALIGHVGATLAAISGFFGIFNSFTLTLPGIAGIILGIGMGVDANVLTASRIREEVNRGRSIDGAIAVGSKRGFTAVLDGNIAILIISIILMGAFGNPDSLFAMMLKPFFFLFGGTTEGTIFSFGYTMFIGVICNLIFGVFCSRIMLRSISKFKRFRKPQYYGGEKE